MRVLSWAFRTLIFLVLLAFALKNADPVSLRFVSGQVWQAPLAVVALLFFAAGALLGALSLLGAAFGQRREIAALRRDLEKARAAATDCPAANPPPAA